PIGMIEAPSGRYSGRQAVGLGRDGTFSLAVRLLLFHPGPVNPHMETLIVFGPRVIISTKPVLDPINSPTRNTRPEVSGLAPPVKRIDLYDGDTFLETTGSTPGGRFARRLTAPLAEGVHTIYAVAIDR